MPTCDVCGKEYDKAIEVIAAGRRGSVRLLRHSFISAGVRALQLSNHRSRGRSRRDHVLLRALRTCGRRERSAHGPRRHPNLTKKPSVMTAAKGSSCCGDVHFEPDLFAARR